MHKLSPILPTHAAGTACRARTDFLQGVSIWKRVPRSGMWASPQVMDCTLRVKEGEVIAEDQLGIVDSFVKGVITQPN